MDAGEDKFRKAYVKSKLRDQVFGEGYQFYPDDWEAEYLLSLIDFALQHSGEQPEEEVELNEKPMVTEIYCDNGELSHYELINTENGEVMWSSFPEETNAMGRKIQSQKQAWEKEWEREKAELVENLLKIKQITTNARIIEIGELDKIDLRLCPLVQKAFAKIFKRAEQLISKHEK